MRIKEQLKKMPLLGKPMLFLYRKLVRQPRFTTSAAYWERRYKKGGNSGEGSYHQSAENKAAFINRFVAEEAICSVIEFGCGDGNQLRYFHLPSYLGIDVSETAVAICRNLFRGDGSKRFELLGNYSSEKAELALSLDVIYHLVEDDVFQAYMTTLFTAAEKFVVIYSYNVNDERIVGRAPHVLYRKFTDWVGKNAPEFDLQKGAGTNYPVRNNEQKNCFENFYVYKKIISE